MSSASLTSIKEALSHAIKYAGQLESSKSQTSKSSNLSKSSSLINSDNQAEAQTSQEQKLEKSLTLKQVGDDEWTERAREIALAVMDKELRDKILKGTVEQVRLMRKFEKINVIEFRNGKATHSYHGIEEMAYAFHCSPELIKDLIYTSQPFPFENDVVSFHIESN